MGLRPVPIRCSEICSPHEAPAPSRCCIRLTSLSRLRSAQLLWCRPCDVCHQGRGRKGSAQVQMHWSASDGRSVGALRQARGRQDPCPLRTIKVAATNPRQSATENRTWQNRGARGSSASPWSGSGRRRGAPSSGATVALLRLDYLLTAFQTHHPTSANSTHGTSARKTISTSSTTKAETAVRLVSAFASSVMKRQRGRSGIG